MRPSRTREERKNQLNYIGENDLKKELEMQAKAKRSEKLKERIQEKNEILEHYQNFKMAGEEQNRDLEEFLNQKKEELVQEKNIYMQTLPPEHNNKPTISSRELERQKRLKLREEERKRRLQGIQDSAYEGKSFQNQMNPLEAVKNPIESKNEPQMNEKEMIKRDLFGDLDNGKALNLEQDINHLENLLMRTSKPSDNEKNRAYNNYSNENYAGISTREINELKETVKKSIDKVLGQQFDSPIELQNTLEFENKPTFNNSNSQNSVQRKITQIPKSSQRKQESENENLGFMVPSMSAQDKRRAMQEEIKRDLEKQIKEKELSKKPKRLLTSETTDYSSYNGRQNQISAPSSNTMNYSPFQTHTHINEPIKADFKDFWPSKDEQEEVYKRKQEEKREYQQALLRQIEEKKRAKTVQESKRTRSPPQENIQSISNFPLREETPVESKKEYREILQRQIEEKKEKERKEKERLARLEFEEEERIKKELENLNKESIAQKKPKEFVNNNKETIKNSMFKDLQEDGKAAFHKFGDVIRGETNTMQVKNFNNDEPGFLQNTLESVHNNAHPIKNEPYSKPNNDEEMLRSFAQDIHNYQQHNNNIRQSRFASDHQKMSALYESSINCRALLEELKQEKEKMKEASSEQIQSIEAMIHNILNEKDHLEFEICSLRAKLDINRFDTKVNVENPIYDEDKPLPSKSDYILFPNSEDLLKESYLKQLDAYKKYQNNLNEVNGLKEEIMENEKSPNKCKKSFSGGVSHLTVQSSFGEDHALAESKNSFSKNETSSHYKSTFGKFKESKFDPIPEQEEFKDLSNNRDNSQSILVSNSQIPEKSLKKEYSNNSKDKSDVSLKFENLDIPDKFKNSSLGINPLDSEIQNISKISNPEPHKDEEQDYPDNFYESIEYESHTLSQMGGKDTLTYASEMEPRPEHKNLDQKTLSQRIDQVIPKDLVTRLIDTNDYSYLWKKRHKFTDSQSQDDEGDLSSEHKSESKDSIDGESMELKTEKSIPGNSTIIDCQSILLEDSKNFYSNPLNINTEKNSESSKARIDSAKSYSKPKIVDVFGKMSQKKSKTLNSQNLLNRLDKYISNIERKPEE